MSRNKLTKRDEEMVAKHLAARLHICGNCIYWAFIHFDNTPNHALCSWPVTIIGDMEPPQQPKFPAWLEIKDRPKKPRDGGRNCPAWTIIKEGYRE